MATRIAPHGPPYPPKVAGRLEAMMPAAVPPIGLFRAARCGCEYEWGVHVAFFAAKAGLTDEQVRSLTHGSADDADLLFLCGWYGAAVALEPGAPRFADVARGPVQDTWIK